MDHSSDPRTADTHISAQGSHRSMRSFIQTCPILVRDYAVNPRRFAVHQPSWWPPLERPWTPSPRPTSSQYSFKPLRNLGKTPEPHVEPSSTSSRTPAQQVRDAYMASQGQADDLGLRDSVMALFAAMERDGIRTKDVDSSQDWQADEIQEWAQQDYTMQLSSIPFPARSDGQEDTRLDLGATLVESGISFDTSMAGSTLADHSVEVAIQRLALGGNHIQSPWPEFHNPGEWTPRVQARRDARAITESTPPGQRLFCPIEGCTRIIDEEQSLRLHLFTHYASGPKNERSINVIPSRLGQHAVDSALEAQDTHFADDCMDNAPTGSRVVLQSDDQEGLSAPHLRLNVLNLEDHPGLQTALLSANAAITNSHLPLQCSWPGCNAVARNARMLGFHMYLHSIEHKVNEDVFNATTIAPLSTDPDVASSVEESKKDRRKFHSIRKAIVQVVKLPFARDSTQIL